jgi:hypothetical protein
MIKDLLRGQSYISYWSHLRGALQTSIRDLVRELSMQLSHPATVTGSAFTFLEELRDSLQQTLDKLRSGSFGGRPVATVAPTVEPGLDTQSREQILIGRILEVCGRAGQIFRPTSMFDYGIDGEIEFKNTRREASGIRLYVQLKSGNSYLRWRKRDRKLIFDIPKKRHIDYWQAQRYDVFLVILDGENQLRWMNVSRYLRERRDAASRQVEFDGEQLDAAAVLKMRDRALVDAGKF